MKPNTRSLKYEELEALCRRMSFSEAAIQRIKAAYESPSRRTRSSGRNVSGHYPSRKNGVTNQFESHKVELPYILMLEYDRDVLAYFAQPSSIKFRSTSKSGRPTAWLDTPDILVIYRDHASYIECKPAATLRELVEKHPDRYVMEADGGWRCPPGEEAAGALGFSYRIWSSDEIAWPVIDNIDYLEDYLRTKPDEVNLDDEIAETVQRVVKNELGITLAQLRHRVQSNIPRNVAGASYEELGRVADTINLMIMYDMIYVDLSQDRLSDQDNTPVYASEAIARAHNIITVTPVRSARVVASGLKIEPATIFTWDGRAWTIVNVGDTEVSILSEQLDGSDQRKYQDLSIELFTELVDKGNIRCVQGTTETESVLSEKGLELLRRCSRSDLEAATVKYHLLFPEKAGRLPAEISSVQGSVTGGTRRKADILKGEKPCPRTLARWQAGYKQGEQKYNCGYLGLVDGRKRSGNNLQRLDPTTEEFLNSYIKDHVEDLTHASYWVEYNAFALSCKEKGIPACSHVTFCAHIRLRNMHEHELKRRGSKGAYPWEPFFFELDLTLPRHGNRPFAIGHLDHTRVDVEIVCYRNGKAIRMGHVWLTLLIDAYTRRILVVYLSYDKPSTDSCMMVLRECVRRWGRLPQTIVVDRGKEFDSTYFETLLALYEITKKSRPGKPRYGSLIERMFGVLNEQFFWALKGNTKLMRNVRQVGKKEQPHNRAVWTLPALYARLCQYCYEEYDRMYHSTLADTPRNVFQEGIIQHGFRGTRRIPYSADFILSTLPTTPKGTAKVQLMGLHVNGRYYWHPDMRAKNVNGKSVDVRYDPFDVSTIQAYIKGRWVECKAAMDYDLLRGRTLKQAELIAQLWREQYGLRGAMRRRNGMELGEFLLVLRQDEDFLMQQLKDDEHKAVLDVIYGHREYTDLIRQTSGQPKPPKTMSGSASLAPVQGSVTSSASRTQGNTTLEILERTTENFEIRVLEDY